MADETVDRELGSEWDMVLLARVRNAVTELGGTMKEDQSGMGGSQEIVEYEIGLDGSTLTVTAETYMGLRLRGPRSFVETLSSMVLPARRDDA